MRYIPAELCCYCGEPCSAEDIALDCCQSCGNVGDDEQLLTSKGSIKVYEPEDVDRGDELGALWRVVLMMAACVPMFLSGYDYEIWLPFGLGGVGVALILAATGAGTVTRWRVIAPTVADEMPVEHRSEAIREL